MSILLTDLVAGHEFDTVTFDLDAQRVRDYIAATADEAGIYADDGVVPPLALAAFALGALLEVVALPEGTLHISESLTYSRSVPLGAAVECRGKLAQRSVRAGMVVSVLETEIRYEGEPAVLARATVMSPGAAS